MFPALVLSFPSWNFTNATAPGHPRNSRLGTSGLTGSMAIFSRRASCLGGKAVSELWDSPKTLAYFNYAQHTSPQHGTTPAARKYCWNLMHIVTFLTRITITAILELPNSHRLLCSIRTIARTITDFFNCKVVTSPPASGTDWVPGSFNCRLVFHQFFHRPACARLPALAISTPVKFKYHELYPTIENSEFNLVICLLLIFWSTCGLF